MKVAVVGATGLVGRTMLRVLEERKFPLTELIPVASQKSVGTEIEYAGKKYKVVSMDDAISKKPEIAIFSAGGTVSKAFAPKFAAVGTTVIDNSSAWRMNVEIPLVVPEINADILTKNDKIIANPNCSTIQMVMALAPLHKKYKVKRIVISTYQSVSGTGAEAINQLFEERNGNFDNKVYPHQIDLNCFPHGGGFLDNGYTEEEMKLVNETRKILRDDSIQVTATVVRIPVIGGHSEAINIEFENDFDLAEVNQLLRQSSGIVVLDNPKQNEYPMPFFAKDKDEVFVGRIRRDISKPKSLDIWVVADNLRKGAATNAVQIAEKVMKLY